MPIDLTEGTTYPATVTVPTGGDNRTALSVRTAFQALADRTNVHQQMIGPAGSGVKRIATAATVATVQALTGMTFGDYVALNGYGLYRFNIVTLTEALPWRIAAAGGGTWVHELDGVRGHPSGLPTLDGSSNVTQRLAYEAVPSGVATLDVNGKVVQPAQNQIVAFGIVKVPNATVSDASVTSTPGAALGLSGFLYGDIVMMQGHVEIGQSLSATARVFATVTDGLGAYDQSIMHCVTTATDNYERGFGFSLAHALTTAGGVSLNLQHQILAAPPAVIHARYAYWVVRP